MRDAEQGMIENWEIRELERGNELVRLCNL